MTAMIPNPLREEEIESRWEAAPAVALVIAMQLLLASVSRSQHWKPWIFPWWVWLIPVAPEILLLLPLAWNRPRRRLEQLGHSPHGRPRLARRRQPQPTPSSCSR
jgi:hypothetical protein